jgi:hypothetical protein
MAARGARAASGKVADIGYLGGAGPITQRAWVDAFVQRLRELGWIEGRTVAIEYRWGEGRPEVRADHQPQDRKGARPHGAADHANDR